MTDNTFNRKEHRIEWIANRQLSVIFAQAQRPLVPKHAQHIADNFDPDMFGTLAVSLPNGKGIYHVIDGHHRKVAVETLYGPDEKVPCEIFNASDPGRAAELFDKINTARLSVKAIDLFYVRVTANEPMHVEVNRIVHTCGYRVGSVAEKSISSVNQLLSIYKSYGAETLAATLKIITKTWGGDKNSVQSPLLRGFAMFMSEHGRGADWNRIADRVSKKYTPGRLIGAAKTAREVQGGSISASIKNIITSIYNTGLRNGSKLKEPKEQTEHEQSAA